MNLSLSERVKIAYKKLKAAIYFDKTQPPLRDKIVAFESGGVEEQLNLIADNLVISRMPKHKSVVISLTTKQYF